MDVNPEFIWKKILQLKFIFFIIEQKWIKYKNLACIECAMSMW